MLTIKLGSISKNVDIMRQNTSGKCNVTAVIKANAYGLGMKKVAPALYKNGIREFFVATLSEGINLRGHIPNDTYIYVLNGLEYNSIKEYIANNVTPVLNDPKSIEVYSNHAKEKGEKYAAILHFDTGMNRLGLNKNETQWLLKNKVILEPLKIQYIMSHFACADIPDHPFTDVQAKRFKKIRAHFPDIPASLSSSSGIFRSPKYHFDMVRPGMGLYGLNPTLETTNPMRPVVEIYLPILKMQTVKKNETIGYGATHRFEKDLGIATLSGGYADGIFRALSNKGHLYWKGQPCPIIGRVSMDLITVDITNIPEAQRPAAGDMMELIGKHQSVDNLAKAADTIGYEILTALGQRYERIYEA